MKLALTRLSMLLLVGGSSAALAQVPQLIQYQGRVLASATNFNGTGQFKFALVNGINGASLWSNDGTSSSGSAPAAAVPLGVSDGLFNVLLGDTSLAHMTVPISAAIFTNADLRLRIWFSSGAGAFQQLTPDQRLGSVGYAMQAASAAVALSVDSRALTNVGTVSQINTGPGLGGGPITSSGTLFIPSGAVSNAMLRNAAVTFTAGPGLQGGGTVALGGTNSLAASLNHDPTLSGNGGASALGLNLANANTWSGQQTFSSPIVGNLTGNASGFTGQLAGDVTGSQGATVISNLLKWRLVSTPSQQAQPNTGYILTNTAQVTLTLPTNAQMGDTFRLSAPGSGGWKIAQNANQMIFAGNFGSLAIGRYWSNRASSANWYSLAASRDGSKLAALVNGGYIFTSTDFGQTWTNNGGSSGSRPWQAVACSADGTKLIASTSSQLFMSTNLGASWFTNTPAANFSAVASSDDGLRLGAAANGGKIWISTDGGISWTARESSRTWYALACSSDGTKWVAAVYNGQVFTSADLGVSWTARQLNGFWRSVASSADGSRLVAVGNSTQIYTSANSGTSWDAHETSRTWFGVACSADGSKLVAAANNGQLYVSLDGGNTWLPRDQNRGWYAVASSADGTWLFAAVSGGQIYFSQHPPISANTTTSPGAEGYLTGGRGTAVELQYVGSNQFLPLSYAGTILAY